MRIIRIFSVAIVLSLSQICWAENDTTVQKGQDQAIDSRQADADPPGTIDGSKTPELISDFKAYEVFFRSIAVPGNSSEFKKWEAKDKFRRAELSDEDTASVIEILAEFHAYQMHLQTKHEQLRKDGATDAEFAKLQSQADSSILSSQSTLQSRLSPEGSVKLHQHIMGLKRKIKLLSTR